MRRLITSLFGLFLWLVAVATATAQDGRKIEPGCQKDQLPGCATICLSKEQHKRVLAHRAKRDNQPIWRPSICDGTDYGSGNCEYARWSKPDDPCSSACSTRTDAYLIYNKSLWKEWGDPYACSIR